MGHVITSTLMTSSLNSLSRRTTRARNVFPLPVLFSNIFVLYLPYFIHLFLFIPLLSSLNLSLYIYQSPTAPSLFQTSTYQPIHSFVNLFVDLILLSDFPSFTFSLHCYFCIYFSFLFVSSSFPLYTVHTVTHSPTQLRTHS